MSVPDASGAPHATIRYPSHWRAAHPSSQMVAITVENPSLQIIVSVHRGRTPQDSEVRGIHQKTFSPLCKSQKLTDLEKRVDAKGVRMFEATCYDAQETVVSRYFAVNNGMIVATTETVKPLDRCTQMEVDRIFQELRVELEQGSSGASADDALSSCPDQIANGPQQGTCLEPAVLGEQRMKACGAQLERKGWKRNAPMESVIGGRTGKVLVCYDKP